MADEEYKRQKAVLRAILNTCIDNGLTATETCEKLEKKMSKFCTDCTIEHMGKTLCDKSPCFVETAVTTYKLKARQKCVKKVGDHLEKRIMIRGELHIVNGATMLEINNAISELYREIKKRDYNKFLQDNKNGKEVK